MNGCDRCSELEAEIEALRDRLHDVGVELADARSTLQAYRHPSARVFTADEMAEKLARDWHIRNEDHCPPLGIVRPKLTVVR